MKRQSQSYYSVGDEDPEVFADLRAAGFLPAIALLYFHRGYAGWIINLMERDVRPRRIRVCLSPLWDAPLLQCGYEYAGEASAFPYRFVIRDSKFLS